jgi:hypothetical protein
MEISVSTTYEIHVLERGTSQNQTTFMKKVFRSEECNYADREATTP